MIQACLILLVLTGWTTVHARTLRLVTLISPPLSYELDGEVAGICTDLVREGLKRLGLSADIKIVPWARGIEMVRNGDADAIFQAGYSEERSQWFHYPEEPLYEIRAVALKRADDPRTISMGRWHYPTHILGMVRDAHFGPKLKAFLDKAEFKLIKERPYQRSNIRMLAEGRIDIYIGNKATVLTLAREMDLADRLEIARDDNGTPIVFDSNPVYLAFSRRTMSDTLAKRFAEALRAMKDDGTYGRIEANHLGR